MPKKLELVGQVFGRLTVVGKEENSGKNTLWICNCECGNIKITKSAYLRRGEVRSCGCLRKEKTLKQNKEIKQTRRSGNHGHSCSNNGGPSPTFLSWQAMRSRCNNVNSKKYPRYGGRGIKVCQEWNDSFEAFLKDMGERPKGSTLDRVDVDGDYCLENCRWADKETQAKNRDTSLSGWLGLRTHCSYGHEFTEENTYITVRGYRRCNICDTTKRKERLKKKETNNGFKCILCNKTLNKYKKEYCSNKCRKIHSDKTPSKEKLEKLIMKYPFTYIAKEYGVSDVTIKNWCLNRGIVNFPGKGYWTKEQLSKIILNKEDF